MNQVAAAVKLVILSFRSKNLKKSYLAGI